ncbi:MAG TPA: hypothetical protein PLM98_19320 [Thiolinea sp.]|nr:hypothetical protein [Thiolinea sp.]
MSDVKNTTETNSETDSLNVKLNTETETPSSQANSSCKRGGCGGDWSKGGWQHRKRRGKVLLAAFLIGLFGFMLGKATSHHHEWHKGYQEQMQSYEGGSQKMPMSMILDGIEATPAQRAKAVELMR